MGCADNITDKETEFELSQPGVVWDGLVEDVENKVIRGWLDWEFVAKNHIWPRVSGEKNVYFYSYFFDKYFAHNSPEKCLSLGCGGGNLERVLLKIGLGEHFDAIDASEGSIKLAQEIAQQEEVSDKINYFVGDINKIHLKENWYDLVIIQMALHHFENLDHIYAEIRKSLKPEGVFCFNEFIGPSRYQWTYKQMEIINEILQMLPEKYRWSIWEKGIIDSIGRPTIEDMLRADPTEAIRSDEIMSRLVEYFDIIERKDYGGTILHMLFNHIMDNFDTSNEDQAAIVNLICWSEKRLLKEGAIPSDFTFVVAKPRTKIFDQDENAPLVKDAPQAGDESNLIKSALQSSQEELASLKATLRTHQNELAWHKSTLQARDEELASIKYVLQARDAELAAYNSTFLGQMMWLFRRLKRAVVSFYK